MKSKKSIKRFSDLVVLIGQASDTHSMSKAEVGSDAGHVTRDQDVLPHIRLERPIKLRCWRVIGQVAKATKRPDLMPVLLRAREGDGTDASDIAKHLLFAPKSRRSVAQRMLDLAERYRLIEQRERRYLLTESGHKALEMQQVLVPEYGTWTIWASDDPLLTMPILCVEPWAEPSAYEEVRGKGRDHDNKRAFKKLPHWVHNTTGTVVIPLVGGAPLRIDQFEANGEEVDVDSEPTLRAMWDVSGARLRVDGTLNGARVSTVIDAPQVGAGEVWMQLLQTEALWPQWDSAKSALRVCFDETTPGERESLVRTVAFKRPNITALGVFKPMTVDGVTLRAYSADDATFWAEWRLRERVRDYATAERFRVWSADAVAPFAEFHPLTPTRPSLAEAVWRAQTNRPTPGAWHLVAAEDWRL